MHEAMTNNTSKQHAITSSTRSGTEVWAVRSLASDTNATFCDAANVDVIVVVVMSWSCGTTKAAAFVVDFTAMAVVWVV